MLFFFRLEKLLYTAYISAQLCEISRGGLRSTTNADVSQGLQMQQTLQPWLTRERVWPRDIDQNEQLHVVL